MLFKKEVEAVAPIVYYKSCSDLFYYNFYRMIETKNYAYLIKGWDEESEIVFNEEKAKKIWAKIYNEYTKLRDDNKLLMYFEICSELLYLETRKEVVTKLLDVLIHSDMEPEVINLYIDELKNWDYRISANKPLSSEIVRMKKQLKQSTNKIRLLYDEKEKFQPEEGEEMSLMKQVVKMEQALGRNEVDPKKVVVEKWVYMIDEIKEVNELKSQKR